MGGVGVAVARGGEGLFYNPAVIPAVKSLEVGLSASAYGFETRTFQDYFLITDSNGNSEQTDLSIRSISSFPSAASTVVPFELLGLPTAAGFGVFIPRGEALDSSTVFDPSLYPLAREGQVEEAITEYWLTGAGAVDLGPVSLGLGVILQLTQMKQLNAFSFFQAGPTPRSPTVYSQLTSVDAIAADLRAQLGGHFDLGALSLGLAILTPTANVGGTSSIRQSSTYSDANFGTDLSTFIIENAGSNNAKPLEFTAGAALTLPGFMITADAAVSLARTYRPVISELDLEPNKEPLALRIALGTEIKWSDDVELRAGAFAVPLQEKLPDETAVADFNMGFSDIDLVNLTEIREYGASIGGSYLRGGGRADFSLTGVLITGHHINFADDVSAGGDLTSKLIKRPVSGFAVLLSMGGTYGFNDAETKESK